MTDDKESTLFTGIVTGLLIALLFVLAVVVHSEFNKAEAEVIYTFPDNVLDPPPSEYEFYSACLSVVPQGVAYNQGYDSDSVLDTLYMMDTAMIYSGCVWMAEVGTYEWNVFYSWAKGMGIDHVPFTGPTADAMIENILLQREAGSRF